MVTDVSVAEAYLRALKRNGIDWIFGNAGTDFAALIEADGGVGFRVAAPDRIAL